MQPNVENYNYFCKSVDILEIYIFIQPHARCIVDHPLVVPTALTVQRISPPTQKDAMYSVYRKAITEGKNRKYPETNLSPQSYI